MPSNLSTPFGSLGGMMGGSKPTPQPQTMGTDVYMGGMVGEAPTPTVGGPLAKAVTGSSGGMSGTATSSVSSAKTGSIHMNDKQWLDGLANRYSKTAQALDPMEQRNLNAARLGSAFGPLGAGIGAAVTAPEGEATARGLGAAGGAFGGQYVGGMAGGALGALLGAGGGMLADLREEEIQGLAGLGGGIGALVGTVGGGLYGTRKGLDAVRPAPGTKVSFDVTNPFAKKEEGISGTGLLGAGVLGTAGMIGGNLLGQRLGLRASRLFGDGGKMYRAGVEAAQSAANAARRSGRKLQQGEADRAFAAAADAVGPQTDENMLGVLGAMAAHSGGATAGQVGLGALGAYGGYQGMKTSADRAFMRGYRTIEALANGEL